MQTYGCKTSIHFPFQWKMWKKGYTITPPYSRKALPSRCGLCPPRARVELAMPAQTPQSRMAPLIFLGAPLMAFLPMASQRSGTNEWSWILEAYVATFCAHYGPQWIQEWKLSGLGVPMIWAVTVCNWTMLSSVNIHIWARPLVYLRSLVIE